MKIKCTQCNKAFQGLGDKEDTCPNCLKKIMKPVDYYGSKDNYIHLKWGDARKAYNFTKEFKAQYPDFVREYESYANRDYSKFDNVFQVATYAFNHEIPVHFYFNFTDTPAKDRAEVESYLIRSEKITRNIYKIMNKYKIEINVSHVVWVYGDNEQEAKEKAEMKVFEERMNHQDGDLITGYKITPLRADASFGFNS